MNRVDAVVFDLGNVLLKFDYYIAANRLMEKNRLASLPDRKPVVDAKAALEAGAIDRAEFLRRVRPLFSDAGSDEDFLVIWRDIFEENLPMSALATRLSTQLPTYLLSNISCIHQEHVFATYPVFHTFRDAVFSYRAGVMKPDPKIYEIAARQFGIDPARTVFFDDMPENIEAARSLGWLAIPYDYRDHAAAEHELRALGVTW